MDLIKNLIATKPPSIKIFIEPNDHQMILMQNDKGIQMEYPTFYRKETIRGKVQIDLNLNKFFDHTGIKIDLVGQIDNYREKHLTSRFITLTKDLSLPGKLTNEINYFDFEFTNVDTEYETYRGRYAGVRYLLQVSIILQYKSITDETEIAILNPQKANDFFIEDNPKLKIEIGVEDWLHVCFELDKTNYHLKDVITGHVSFKKAGVNFQGMELQLVRKESLFNLEGDNEVVGRFEIMDGTPSSLDVIIPIRLYLRGYRKLTPSFLNINNKFSVKYFVCLELADFEDRRFFKRMEINLTRIEDEFYQLKKYQPDSLNDNMLKITEQLQSEENIL